MKDKLKPATKRSGLTREQILADTNGQRLLIKYCDAIEAGELPPDAILRELAASFRRILRGEQPKKALDLSLPRGRPEPTGAMADKRASIVMEVMERRESGDTKEDAIAVIAPRHFINEETLRKWCLEYEHLAKAFLKAKKMAIEVRVLWQHRIKRKAGK